jgi:pyrimidine operon attenuation protein/uracil phosphoribosyltransferase
MDRPLKQLLSAEDMAHTLDAMAEAIYVLSGAQNLILMGLASRGIPLARELASRLETQHGTSVPVGSLDATFYRDDFHYRKKVNNFALKISEMPADVEGKVVVLVDDVLYTGRSVRAAMQAILDLGRPAAIRLCVLVDRGHRELPIAPDCVGLTVQTAQNEEVRVRIAPCDTENAVWLVEVGEAS